MRVLYFSRDYTTHDRRFLKKLAESRHEVWFLRLEDDGIRYEERELPDGIHQVNWTGGQQRAGTPDDWFRLMPDYQAVLDQIRPDLVHAGPVQSCGFMTALTGFHPLLVVSWGSDILVDADRDKQWRWVTNYTLDRSDMLQCDCQAVRSRVQELTPYSDDCIVQFPWGVDLDRFSPGKDTTGLRDRPGWGDSIVVISTRTWEPLYDIEVLLKAFLQAYGREPRLRLALLGSGSLATVVNKFITDHELDSVIWRPGMVSHQEMPDFFRMADIYISCASSDGTSVSLLEAMASGMPVVVTDVPGNSEWVVPGENGWMAPKGDASAFARLLLEAVATSSAQRERISSTNRKLCEERANWHDNFNLLLKAYDQLEVKYAH